MDNEDRLSKEKTMKVLLAIDGSHHSQAALDEAASRPWPAGTEFRVLTVLQLKWLSTVGPLYMAASADLESIQEQKREARDLLDGARTQLQASTANLRVSTKVLEGQPHEMIVEEAEAWRADLIVLGSHGYGPLRRALLGSVAAAVAVEAPCAVEIIRVGRPFVRAPPRRSDSAEVDATKPVGPSR
jgi:nucleotide-binding universal stress UspA family protein